MSERTIDLNCDLGESYGVYRYGADEELMPLITSANVACGFHASDPTVMRETVSLAAAHGVRIGAHMGLPDRLGFGRRRMDITAEQAYDDALYQIGALDAFLVAGGLEMAHVKPHGQLYMMAVEREDLARAILAATAAVKPGLRILALPGSPVATLAAGYGLSCWHEFYADRPYRGAEANMFAWSYDELGSPQDAADRVEGMLTDPLFPDVRTICTHSDTLGSPAIVAAVRQRLESLDIRVG